MITIGANDFGDHHDQVVAATCPANCVSDELEQLSGDLHRILERIRALRAGRATTTLVTGYWNVFEDGQVARQNFSADGRAATVELTQRVNAVIAAATIAEGATSVDLAGPFQRERADVTGLLAPDGDHPDAAGHQLIAEVLLAAGLPTDEATSMRRVIAAARRPGVRGRSTAAAVVVVAVALAIGAVVLVLLLQRALITSVSDAADGRALEYRQPGRGRRADRAEPGSAPEHPSEPDRPRRWNRMAPWWPARPRKRPGGRSPRFGRRRARCCGAR